MSTREGWHSFEWFPESGVGAAEFWVEHVQRLARQAHDTAYTAVCAWAKQAKMTPAEWLERWEPVTEFVHSDPLEHGYTIKCVVTARVRGVAR